MALQGELCAATSEMSGYDFPERRAGKSDGIRARFTVDSRWANPGCPRSRSRFEVGKVRPRSRLSSLLVSALQVTGESMIDAERLQQTVLHLVSLLVDQQYSELEKLSDGKRLSAAEIQHAVTCYGRTLTMPPVDVDEADVIEVIGSNPTRWSVIVRLYTQEEGLSDLSLDVSLIESDGLVYRAEIEDLHVR